MLDKLFEKRCKLWALEGRDLRVGDESGRTKLPGNASDFGVGYGQIVESAGKASNGICQKRLVPIIQFELEDASCNLQLGQRPLLGFVWVSVVTHDDYTRRLLKAEPAKSWSQRQFARYIGSS